MILNLSVVDGDRNISRVVEVFSDGIFDARAQFCTEKTRSQWYNIR